MVASVMIVDEVPRVRASLTNALATIVDDVRAVETAEAALAQLTATPVDVVLSDVRLPGMSGVELLQLVRQRLPGVDVILMSGYDDLPMVAAAMREGAADFLVKPLDLHQLRSVLLRVAENRRDAGTSRRGEGETAATAHLVGRDPRMIEVFKVVGQVAATRTTVLIRGESGTGKELIARAIHDTSSAAAEPFIAVNCTAVPTTLLESELFGHVRGAFTGAVAARRGRFALAGRGTLFLDEIGDTSLDFQAKLLRVLQEREYYPVGAERPERTEARVIAATHRDLERLMQRGDFREDLYYRLRVVEIVVPPLRERGGDIPLLAEALVRKASDAVGRCAPTIGRDAMERLLVHPWAGNVRELENCLTRAVVVTAGDVIRADALALEAPAGDRAGRDLATLDHVEREHVLGVLKAMKGHKARTARILGVSRPRLDRLLRKHGLGRSDVELSVEG